MDVEFDYGTIEIEPIGVGLRDWFAGQALSAFLARPEYDGETFNQAAIDAYQYADAMLKAREK